MAEPLYVGHQAQLQHLADELRPYAHSQQSPVQLFHICGPKGSGRRTFIRRLWSEISDGEVPRVLFSVNNAGDGELSDQLLNDALSNRAYLEDALQRIADEADGQAKRLEEAGNPLADDAKITLWSELVEQHLLENPANGRDLQILLFLPDFGELPKDTMDTLAQAAPRGNGKVDCRILTSGPDRGEFALIQKIFPDRVPADEIELPALTVDDIEQWLHSKQASIELTAELYKRCGGLPGKMESALNEVMEEHRERSLIAQAEDALKGTNAELAKCLCLAAMLPEINEQALLTLMSPEDASATMLCLRQRDWQDSGWNMGSFVAAPKIRQALVKFLERNFPADYKKAVPVAEQFGKIHSVIPSGKHRETIARLSAFNYFNLEVLKEVMPDIALEMAAIIKANPGYFENTGKNLRLRPEVRQAAEAFMSLAKFVIPQEDRTRIATAWEAQRRKIMEMMHTAEEKVGREESSLSDIQSQIKQVSSSIDHELNHISRLRRKSSQKAARAERSAKSGGGIKIWRLVLEGIGTVILYFSFLFYSRSSIVYAAVGIGLILTGLFVNGRTLAPAREPQAGPPVDPLDIDRYEKNLKFLNIKKNQLENRQNTIASSIAHDRSSIKDYDKQLREPYS